MRTFVVPDGGTAAQKNGYAQVLAVHAALLESGKIVYFSGDQHDPGQHSHGLFDHARLFDCATLAVTSPAPSASIRDLFCCGHAFLGDGRLLVGGGTEAWTLTMEAGADPHGHAAAGHFRGTPDAYLFDPGSESWDHVARMVPEPGHTTGGGRWYPTLLTLADGRILALSGHPSDADDRHYNDTIEVFSPSPYPDGQWADVGTLPGDITYYPRGHLLPDGTVFFSSPIGGQSHRYSPTGGAWTPVAAGPSVPYDGFSTSSVLLPLLPESGYRPRVLITGAPVPHLIDLGAASPSWQPTVSRTLSTGGGPPARTHSNAVILPTGDVAIVGGLRDPGQDPTTAVLPVEIFRPSTGTWLTLPSAANCTVPRNYHSVALLMPDGRVWMGGSNRQANWSFHNAGDYPASLPTTAQDGSIDNRELRIEILEPWYFGRPDRPVITAAPASASVGTTVEVSSPQAGAVSRVALIRAGSSTHSFNPDQRYVGLPFTVVGGSVHANLPDNPALLPPGYYLLFVTATVVDPGTGAPLDVPSVGTFIRVDNGKTDKELWLEVDDWKTLRLELKDLKGEVEDFLKPWEWVIDPPPFIREMARRLDNLAREPVGRPFIPAELRPDTGGAAKAIGRTFQRSLEQILADEHPAHMAKDPGRGGHMGHDVGAKPRRRAGNRPKAD